MTRTTQLVTAFGAALTTGDLDQIHSLLSDDVAYQVPGRNPAAGIHHGRDEVVTQLTAPIGPATHIDSVEVTESMVDGQRGLVIVVMKGTTSGQLFAVETAFHLQTHGEAIIGITEYSGDQHLLDTLLDVADVCETATPSHRSARWAR